MREQVDDVVEELTHSPTVLRGHGDRIAETQSEERGHLGLVLGRIHLVHDREDRGRRPAETVGELRVLLRDP